MIKKIILCIIISVQAAVISAKIKEKELSGYKAAALSKIIESNPGKETEIRRSMNGLVKNSKSGIRLIDKFALFLYDCNTKGLTIEKIKFYKDGNINLFIITLKDKSDNGIYNLSLEYTYIAASDSFVLSDISFSMIFHDKIKSAAQFFGGG